MAVEAAVTDSQSRILSQSLTVSRSGRTHCVGGGHHRSFVRSLRSFVRRCCVVALMAIADCRLLIRSRSLLVGWLVNPFENPVAGSWLLCARMSGWLV